MPEIRIDRTQKITSVDKTDEGYLIVVAPIARSGVYNYLKADGSLQREYIPPETLKNDESIKSLHLKPVTNDHPSQFVDSENYQDVTVGSVGETVFYEDGKLHAKFTVTATDGLEDVEAGKTQLSPGYVCDVEIKSGITPDGEHYDAIQTNRRYNHLAIVDRARGGDQLNFKMDSSLNISVEVDCFRNDNLDKGDTMPKSIKIDGVDVTVDDQVASHVASLNTKIDGLKTDVTTKETANVELQGKLDSSEAKVINLQTKLDEKVSPEKLDTAVAEKLALIGAASKVLGDDKVDATDSAESIMESVVVAVNPNLKVKIDAVDEGMKPVYLKACFDSALESFEADGDADEKARKSLKVDGDQKVDARAKHTSAMENKWKAGK